MKYIHGLNAILFIAQLNSVNAELALVAQTNRKDANQMPVRIVDGYLCVNGDGPIFQGEFDEGALVLSDRVVSEEAAGAAIGVSDDGLLIVSFNASNSFHDRNGWLDYNGRGIFGLKEVGKKYQIYVGRPDLENSIPALIELAAVAE